MTGLALVFRPVREAEVGESVTGVVVKTQTADGANQGDVSLPSTGRAVGVVIRTASAVPVV